MTSASLYRCSTGAVFSQLHAQRAQKDSVADALSLCSSWASCYLLKFQSNKRNSLLLCYLLPKCWTHNSHLIRARAVTQVAIGWGALSWAILHLLAIVAHTTSKCTKHFTERTDKATETAERKMSHKFSYIFSTLTFKMAAIISDTRLKWKYTADIPQRIFEMTHIKY